MVFIDARQVYVYYYYYLLITLPVVTVHFWADVTSDK